MSGERLAWHRVASHLRLTIRELKERITLTEFRNWLEFLLWEEERHSKQDYYLAQIAAEVRRGQVKHPRRVQTQDLLLGYATTTVSDRVEKSKQAWAAVLKLDIDRN